MNRAVGRRTLFENEQDVRMFLAFLARRVRAGQIEISAFSILTSHYHLLVRSPRGEVSDAIGLVQKNYAHWFNRTRDRDGPLFRGRFLAKPVDTLTYRRILVRYIDFNPVAAGLVASPTAYRHGSARHYVAQRGPPWLEREWIEREVVESLGRDKYAPSDYSVRFGTPLSKRIEVMVERRIRTRQIDTPSTCDPLEAADGRVLEWMLQKAQRADGVGVGVPVCAPDVVLREIETRCAASPEWSVRSNRKRTPAWQQLKVASLRELCGLTWSGIASRVGASPNGCWRLFQRHRACVELDAEYAKEARDVAEAALSKCWTPEVHGSFLPDSPPVHGLFLPDSR